jgi:predicted anti-sigma-YlaC factor YlaD
VHSDCERARQWASIDVDGELSTFEGVLLRAHLAECPSCREFHDGIEGATRILRSAPLEQLETGIEIGRTRRRARLRLAPAAAAMAVAAVGLGSLLASSAVRSGPVGSEPVQVQGLSSGSPVIDTMNLSTSQARARQAAIRQNRLASRAVSAIRGGPVVRER